MLAAPMDPRIGILMRGGHHVHYAFVDGYDKPAFEGTREAVEERLGRLDSSSPIPQTGHGRVRHRPLKTWNVTMRFRYPAWDEKDGIEYRGISARSKSEANKFAARQALSDGHAVGGRGPYWFTAAEAED